MCRAAASSDAVPSHICSTARRSPPALRIVTLAGSLPSPLPACPSRARPPCRCASRGLSRRSWPSRT
eukprot:7357531-Prymnesium_polylepis.2